MTTSTDRQLGLSGQALDESRKWFERAKLVLAGGISSSARATTTGDHAFPLYMTHGRGSRIWDADGHEYVDHLLAYGSAVLGHADADLGEILRSQLDLGTMFGTCNTVEVQLAEQICRMVPCADLVRFANSGSEAICAAVRGARALTGREKVLKFEGHYHGWVDVLGVSNRPTAAEMGPLDRPHSAAHSKGTPAGVVQDVIVCPWNEPEILKQILTEHEGKIAAIIAEPLVANNACIEPRPGYLELLRSECDRRSIVLIYDEIVTGFRVALGGAQELLGVEPDVAVYSKALGGGLPMSALAGRRRFMEQFATGQARHGGTYNGSPLCAAAALHTLQRLAAKGTLERMRDYGQRLIECIRRAAADRDVLCVVQGVGSMFQVLFGITQPARHYRDLEQVDAKRFAKFRMELLRQGVHINHSGTACWFVSAAHNSQDGDITTAAIEQAMDAVR
jgi:glutamate-1-semialdehyde 2,1-aminomutase